MIDIDLSNALDDSLTLQSQFYANKNLGQHFLRDKNIIQKIVRAIDIQPEEQVVEIGPGPGAMTIPMLALGAHVTVIEKDARFQSVLMATSKSRGGKLDFMLQDALKVQWQDIVPEGGKVVGNLPYNVGTHIVLDLLKSRVMSSAMVFMLQKEVIDRFLAKPSTPERGRISIWCELLADGESLFDVSRAAFNPPPKVTSAVMRLVPLKKPRYDVDMKKLKQILDTTFNQRRKMIRASLRDLMSSEDIVSLGIDPAARPETLTTEQFCTLANFISS